jgi:cell division protein FtsB
LNVSIAKFKVRLKEKEGLASIEGLNEEIANLKRQQKEKQNFLDELKRRKLGWTNRDET